MEAQLAIEASAVGGHQINPFHSCDGGGMQEFLDHAAPLAMALQVTGHHDVPQHSSAEAIGGGSPKAHQPFAAPQTHYGIAAP